jgi:hypothetical protein
MVFSFKIDNSTFKIIFRKTYLYNIARVPKKNSGRRPYTKGNVIFAVSHVG